VHASQPVDGGTAAVVRTLAAAGVAAGDEVTVACPVGPLATWAAAVGARWVPLAMERAPGPADYQSFRRLRGIVADSDVVHLHSSKAGALGRLLRPNPTAHRPRVVFTPHAWSWYSGGPASSLVYRRFEQFAARRADVITVVSRDEQRDGEAVLGDRAKLVLIPNGVDLDRFRALGEVAARADSPLLVQVGRLSRQKGQDRSIRAVAALADVSTRLRLVGDGPLRGELEALAAELGVSHRVEFVGEADPRPHVRAADLVVLPSRWEGLSLVLLESMAMGAAIIGTECGGSDVLGGVGVVVTNSSEEACVAELAVAVDQLLSDPSRRAAMGDGAERRVLAEYTEQRMIERYREVWDGAPMG
jgi:glycosyltransferase involved in cell wall biosynthesis